MVDSGLPWAVDNGAFSGFDPVAFRALCVKVASQPRLLWVACPDVVGDSVATLGLFDEWEAELHAQRLPVAFVLQDGCERLPVPWDRPEAVFIGGSTEFKLSADAELICMEAKRRGKLVHMGRVNSFKRLRHAAAIGCDTVDGTAASMFGDVFLPKFARWIGQVNRERELF